MFKYTQHQLYYSKTLKCSNLQFYNSRVFTIYKTKILYLFKRLSGVVVDFKADEKKVNT